MLPPSVARGLARDVSQEVLRALCEHLATGTLPDRLTRVLAGRSRLPLRPPPTRASAVRRRRERCPLVWPVGSWPRCCRRR